MSDYDALCKAIGTLAGSMRELQQQAARQYKPVVDDILLTRSRDVRHIEHTLDRLLDFCGHEPVLQLYKKLCRHYWDIDPAATADYINAYREYWDTRNLASNTKRPSASRRSQRITDSSGCTPFGFAISPPISASADSIGSKSR